MTHRVALFDLDDTLIDRQAAFEQWLRGFVSAYGLPDAAAAGLREADRGGYAPRAEMLAVASERFGVEVPVERLVEEYHVTMPSYARVFPSVVDGLTRLRTDGWSIGVVTNGGSTSQRLKITSAGLQNLVDAVAVSDDIGCSKPDRRIFSHTLDALSVNGDARVWMVGDNLSNDVGGGNAAGFTTVWVSGSAVERAGGLDPDPTHTCATIADAFTLLLRG